MANLGFPPTDSATRKANTPLAGEAIWDEDEERAYIGDGKTQGGIPLAQHLPYSQYVYGVDRDQPITATATSSYRVELDPDYDYEGAAAALRYKRINGDHPIKPAHNLRRCVVSDLKNQTVAFYLNASDSTKKANGTALTQQELAGSAGDFCVHMPVFYRRIDTYMDGSTKRYVYLVSDRPFRGATPPTWFYTGPGGNQLQDQFVGAFPSVVCNSDGSVKAQDSDNCPAALGGSDILRSIPGGRPAALINRANFRAGHARAGGLTSAYITSNPEYNGTVTSVDDAFFEAVILLMMIDYNDLDFKTRLSVGFAYCNAYRYASQRLTGRTLKLGNVSGEVEAVDAASGDLDYDIVNTPAYITAASVVYDRYPAGDATGVFAWKYGTAIRYTNTETIVANTTKCYSDTALSAGETTITAYTAAGANWKPEAVSNHALRVVAMSWRGLENIYAAIWCNADGVQKYQDNYEADIFDTDSSITVSGTTYTRDQTKDSGMAYAWKNGSTWIYTTRTNNPAVGADVYSDNTLSTSAGTIASKNIVEYDRYEAGDYTSGSFHSYAWKNGSTTIWTKDTPHPAVGAATFSDNTCQSNRSKNITAWDDDFSQSGYWFTNDTTLYTSFDADMGYGPVDGKMPATGYTGSNIVWIHHAWPKAGGYVMTFDPETFKPLTVGGGTNTNLAAYFYNDTAAGARLVIRGGALTNTASVSPAYVNCYYALGLAHAAIGSRLAAHAKKTASSAS